MAPGKPEESLLIRAVRRTGDLKMPPDGKLTEQEIADLVTWVKSGAVWPGVTVEATSPAFFENARTTLSDRRGEYRLRELPRGIYTVVFRTARRDGLDTPHPRPCSPNTSRKALAISPSVARAFTAATIGGMRFCSPCAVRSRPAQNLIPRRATLPRRNRNAPRQLEEARGLGDHRPRRSVATVGDRHNPQERKARTNRGKQSTSAPRAPPAMPHI